MNASSKPDSRHLPPKGPQSAARSPTSTRNSTKQDEKRSNYKVILDLYQSKQDQVTSLTSSLNKIEPIKADFQQMYNQHANYVEYEIDEGNGLEWPVTLVVLFTILIAILLLFIILDLLLPSQQYSSMHPKPC